MTIETGTPDVAGLDRVVERLGQWQGVDGVVQLHPGDLGWFWRFGVEHTAGAVRTWQRDGEILAIGLLDEPDMLRLAVAPDALRDDDLAQAVVADAADPARGVLIEGKVYLDAPMESRVQELLSAAGWEADDPWQPLVRDLAAPVEDPGIAVEVVTAESAAVRTAVQRASFDGSTFTDERWHTMAAGTPYARARCLLGRDAQGEAVAAVTVWSAGEGRIGLIEPMGVHRDHRGRGYGQAITVAAAAALRELGASRAMVCTPSFNVGAVATYRAAGFEPLAEIRARSTDRTTDAV
ncbi:GCN5-related N-acetyltransferase [Kribbella flavida DSM 17836]|uniref:GCN5-related N-acetyltransferase n=1 Tax=Kribbella flavida (strain DSM 17836 / JCM 10339 / NBRC 14399) TaxID=479435 RepID=D2Q2Z6_KRIFD|nr:GNAT family N-acetyltransferase [Kribbella flavida]ADB32121.1 GCN5-related N-acetyltransferase [Kribbella flavida DSM 17836]